MNYQPTQIEIESSLATTQGLFQMKLSQYGQAIPHFDKAIEINPNNWTALQARAFCKSMLFSHIPNAHKDQHLSEIISDLSESIEFLTQIKDIITDIKS